MVSLVASPATTATSADPTNDLDDANFITINPHNKQKEYEKTKTSEFEFLSTTLTSSTKMLSADELFFEGKLLPFGHYQCHEKLMKINLKNDGLNGNVVKVENNNNNNININNNNNNIVIINSSSNDISNSNSSSNSNNNNNRMGWFIDEDPSPRPPKCTVLWKELLRLRKHRGSSLSTSASTSSSSSSSSSSNDEESKKEKVKRVKKGLERTRSAGIKIRPMVNVPVCSQARSNSMPPVYSGRKGMLDR